MSLGSRVAFATWKLYRTSSIARRALDPVIRKRAVEGLAAHERFADGAVPSDAWAAPRPTAGAPLRLVLPAGRPGGPARARLLALLNHWAARYEVRDADPEGEIWKRDPDAFLLEPAGGGGSLAFSSAAVLGRDAPELTLGEWRERKHALAGRVLGTSPFPGLRATVAGERRIVLDPGVLAPRFVASPWGSVVPDAIDLVLGRADWREPLAPLVSARVDDVTGAAGLGWLAALEERGIRPSVGTLHDAWLRAGPAAVRGLVEASRRGVSVSPHAFDMDRFVWFHAQGGAPFSRAVMEEHRARIARDVAATGLVLGKTVNAHFDVVGSTGADAALALGFEFLLGEHEVGQDWREPPRRRDPLGTPLYSYGWQGGLFGYQAEGAIASSAAPGSRYDWLRNFLETDPATNRPLGASLDRKGAVAQGATQLLSALFAGFPAYLLAHEVHLDAIGRETVAELLDAVLAETRVRVPSIRLAAWDELPATCRARAPRPPSGP